VPGIFRVVGVAREENERIPGRRHFANDEVACPHAVPREEGIEEGLKAPFALGFGEETFVDTVESTSGDQGERFPHEDGDNDPDCLEVVEIDDGEDEKVVQKEEEPEFAEGGGEFAEEKRAFLQVTQGESGDWRGRGGGCREDCEETGPGNEGCAEDILMRPAEAEGRRAPSPDPPSFARECLRSAGSEAQAFVKVEGGQEQIKGLRVGHRL